MVVVCRVLCYDCLIYGCGGARRAIEEWHRPVGTIFFNAALFSSTDGSGGEVTIGRGVVAVLGHHLLRRVGQKFVVAWRRGDAAGVTPRSFITA
jgi:hypothetical protein